MRRSCCPRCCHSHSPGGTDTAAAKVPSSRFPRLRSGAGVRPARSGAEENRPNPREEGGGEGRKGEGSKEAGRGAGRRARSVLNGLGGRIVRPQGRGVGTEKGGWKAETFL